MTTQQTTQQTQIKEQTEATDFERLLKKEGKQTMEFVPFGSQDKIKLSVKIVQDLLAVPTKSGKSCSDRDAMKFMMMCQAKRINPFEGDAFLIGYDGQNGPQFSLITAHQTYLKRAEIHPEYDGMESGVVVVEGDGTPTDIPGDFYAVGQEVVGGWAKVYFKNRKVPTYRRIRLERFNKGIAQWKDDAPGMICKCAEADALRSSFPTMLGGLYLREEFDFIADTGSGKQTFEAPTNSRGGDLVEVVNKPAPEGEKEPEVKAGVIPEQEQLAILINELGFTFEEFCKWAGKEGQLQDPLSYPEWSTLPTDVCKRMLRAKAGLKTGLEKMRGAV